VLFVSSEALGHGIALDPQSLIVAVYRQVLKRRPDAVGLQHYTRELLTGSVCVREIVRDLMHSEEWAARFIDGRTVEETALALYDCVLARAPDVGGWNELTTWEPRNGWGPVFDSMIDGTEYSARFGADVVPGEASAGPT
jgi:hypothetical protein